MGHFCFKRIEGLVDEIDADPGWFEMRWLSAAFHWPTQLVAGQHPSTLVMVEYRRRDAMDYCPAVDRCSSAECYYQTGILYKRNRDGSLQQVAPGLHHQALQQDRGDRVGLDGLEALVATLPKDGWAAKAKGKKHSPASGQVSAPVTVTGKQLSLF